MSSTTLKTCKENFVKTGLNIDDYSFHEARKGHWIWTRCAEKPELIKNSSRSDIARVKRRMGL